jgi:hypothetical protein
MGKSTINVVFSIAMLNYQRVRRRRHRTWKKTIKLQILVFDESNQWILAGGFTCVISLKMRWLMLPFFLWFIYFLGPSGLAHLPAPQIWMRGTFHRHPLQNYWEEDGKTWSPTQFSAKKTKPSYQPDLQVMLLPKQYSTAVDIWAVRLSVFTILSTLGLAGSCHTWKKTLVIQPANGPFLHL